MNIVMVNTAHPSTPHISATRAWQFALELSKLGHRVVLVCIANTTEQITDSAELNAHDWSTPFILAPSMQVVNDNSRPALLRKALTFMQMVWVGGNQGAWGKSAVKSISALNPVFKPELIWATFGRMESVLTARSSAIALQIPWVLDLKDNWNQFIPKLLRRFMAWRCRGFAALTANAQFTMDISAIHKFKNGEVIYSGVQSAFFDRALEKPCDKFCINIVGGLYFDDKTIELLSGIHSFLRRNNMDSSEHSVIRYSGAESERFARCAQKLGINDICHNLGYLPIEQMAAYCASAHANAYVCNNITFHHKVLELLASGKPMIAYGGDISEAINLANDSHTAFYEPMTPEAVIEVFEEIRSIDFAISSTTISQNKFSWKSQAALLENILKKAVAHEQ